MKITIPRLLRWAGLSALIAGLCYTALSVFHPLNVPASVTTTRWEIVHILAMAMCYFGVLGMTGLYAKQAHKAGWLGLAGYLLFTLWLVLIAGFAFVEVFVLPIVATPAPTFVAGWLGMFTGTPSQINLAGLPLLWTLSGPVYILGGLLFGIATYRAHILPRWAGILLAVGTTLGPAAVLLPPAYQLKAGIPVGLALVWLGYALWTDRSEQRTHTSAVDTTEDVPAPVTSAPVASPEA
jgi:hypothetical protein